MRFLIDAQLPWAMCRQIAALGHSAEHVGEAGLASARDEAIWRHAARLDAVIVTKDEDFARRKALREGGPAIVWIRVPNTRRRELLAWFDAILPDVIRALERGEGLIEIVRGPFV